MVRVVFDTVGFVRCLINPFSFWGRIIFQYSSQYQLFVSKEVLQEIFEVLQRPEVVFLAKSTTNLDKRKVIEIVAEAEAVEITDVELVSRDPKDDKFLATAKAAKADYLVSADKDLLDLKEYKGIKIIDAETFLHILEDKKND